MSTRLAPSPPDWFLSRDYGYTKSLDPERWLIALLDRIRFDAIPQAQDFVVSGKSDPWQAHRNSYPSPQALFDAFLASTEGPPGKFRNNLIIRAAREVLSEEETQKALNSDSVALIAVELEATEGTIISQFKEWLEKRKKVYPGSPITLPGNPRLENKKLSQRTLRSWSDQRILQLFDLVFWRKVFQHDISDSTLGGWLFYSDISRRSDPIDKYKYPMKKLREAIDLVGPLRFEQYEWGKN